MKQYRILCNSDLSFFQPNEQITSQQTSFKSHEPQETPRLQLFQRTVSLSRPAKPRGTGGKVTDRGCETDVSRIYHSRTVADEHGNRVSTYPSRWAGWPSKIPE